MVCIVHEVAESDTTERLSLTQSYGYSVDHQMLFLFNDFPVLKTFSSYIAIFELEMCQIYTNLGFDITNECLRKS